MEKGVNSSSGFRVSDKKSSPNVDSISSVKLEISNEAFPSRICLMGIHHQENNLNRQFAGGDGGGGGGGGGSGGVGPTNNSGGGANEVVGNIYRDDISSFRGGENFATGTKLQPFDIFPSSYSTNPYKSPAGGMAADMGFPFTYAQWKELERQAMIYKYMISSVPVPPDLLFPLSRNFPVDSSSASSIYNGRYSRNGDPEPGRCKRTDGKKWRCSREVAPHQKYCERHLHRGRPRSRKPVEVKNNDENRKKTRLDQSQSLPTIQSNCAANDPLLLFNAKTDLSISTPSSVKCTNRDLSLTMEAKTAVRNDPEQPWQHLMEANMGLTNDWPLNMFSYPNYSAPEIEAPIGFIDAWSIDNVNSRNNGNLESSISLNKGDLSPSLNLSMAMAAGDVLDEEMGNIQMGDSVKDCDDHKMKDYSTWLSPVSWEPFARGGPLGEALQPGSLAIGWSNPASPYNSISTVATTVSSPSGVLQRTLISQSDSSVCNSPTPAAPAPPEVAIQWLN